MQSLYETQTILDQYLLLHYGTLEDQLPFNFGPAGAVNFPQRCVSECIDNGILPENATALDLGCAVGRSSFELSRYCSHVVGLDNSKVLIAAANELLKKGQIEYKLPEESSQITNRTAFLPDNINRSRVEFLCSDAMELPHNNTYDVVLVANLICRLPDPAKFLNSLHHLVKANGQLIIVSPYSWLEEFTHPSKWLEKGLESIKLILEKHFHLKKYFDIPFLIREHKRKYQWGISQASVWIKN
jgi:putative 4-mercaptohistidine N1-methyltranferase